MDLSDLRSGRRGAVARAITAIENDPVRARKIIDGVFRHTGGAAVVGFTGLAGAGKSTLINAVASRLKREGMNPAVLAVDPTSHISGGAILGDRVRMTELADSGVYIRSVASRGATGAISDSLQNSVRVLDYAGFDPVIVESVGAGQTEVGITDVADIIVVLFSPQTGDGIQAIKAGLTEIGDIYLVNKSDLAGSSRLYNAICDHIGTDGGRLILKTSTKSGEGIAELVDAIKKAAAEPARRDPGRAARRREAELRNVILNNIARRVVALLEADDVYRECLAKVRGGEMSPFEAADRVSEGLMR